MLLIMYLMTHLMLHVMGSIMRWPAMCLLLYQFCCWRYCSLAANPISSDCPTKICKYAVMTSMFWHAPLWIKLCRATCNNDGCLDVYVGPLQQTDIAVDEQCMALALYGWVLRCWMKLWMVPSWALASHCQQRRFARHRFLRLTNKCDILNHVAWRRPP